MCGRRYLATIVVAICVIGCGGEPPDLGTVRPVDAPADLDVDWTVVAVEGIVLAPSPTTPDLIEVSENGDTATVFFRGGNTRCYAVAGVDVFRRDPEIPEITVRYGTRLGVMGCTAEGTFLALRVPLDPPLAR